jgi:hypothetical protein
VNRHSFKFLISINVFYLIKIWPLYFIRKLYIILKLGLFISESGPSLRSDSPIARIGEPGGTVLLLLKR